LRIYEISLRDSYKTIESSSEDIYGHYPDTVFDGIVSQVSSWQVQGTGPHWVRYNYGNGVRKRIVSYKISLNDDRNEYSPRNWIFEGSNDGVHWAVLDSHSDETPYGKFESRTYSFNNTEAYQYYQLKVLDLKGATFLKIADMEFIEGPSLDTMRFSTDKGVTWTQPEKPATTKTLTLPEGDGQKEVRYEIVDAAGNVTPYVSDVIILDTTGPTGTIKINDGAAYTITQDVTLKLTANDLYSTVDKMQFSTDGGTSWSDWENFSAAKSLTLPYGNGTKKVQYRLRDKLGNVTSDILSDEILLRAFSGALSDLKFSNLTASSVILEPEPNASDLSIITKWSYSIDGGAYSAAAAYPASKTLSLPAGNGRHTIDLKFYDEFDNASSVYYEEIDLDAIRAVIALDPAAENKSLHTLVQEGLLRTDKRGNLENLYSRDLVEKKTQFASPSFRIDPLVHGATLPSLSAEFEVQSTAPSVLFETGFTIPGQFLNGKTVEGTAKLVIEDGLFKLKVTNPREEIVDGVPLLVSREEVITPKQNPQIGKAYELQFDYTLAGLQIYLDEGTRAAGSEPLLILAGAKANPYLQGNSVAVKVKAVHVYGNTKKVLTSDNQIHNFTYTRSADGKLTGLTDRVEWSRFADANLKNTAYEIKKTFDDASGRLISFVNPNGEKTEWAYNAEGKVLSQKDPSGAVQNFTYGANGALTQTVQYTDGFGNVVTGTTKETWDTNGRRTYLELPSGKKINFVYGEAVPAGGVGASQDVTASVTEGSFSYAVSAKWDARGRSVELKNRAGVTENRVYQNLSNGGEEMTATTKTVNGTATYTTTEKIITGRDGKILESQNAQGIAAKYTYDAEGDLIRFEDGKGRITTWTYTKNAFGAILRSVETLAFTDDYGNVISAKTSREFDLAGNLIAEVNADGDAFVHVYEFYDYNRQLKKRTSYHYRNIASLDALTTAHKTPSALVSSTQWNEAGDTTLVVEENSVEIRTQLMRDAKGNVTQQSVTTAYLDGTNPISRTETKEFDLRGNLKKEIDYQGDTISYEYDALNQLLKITHHLKADNANTFDRVTSFKLVKDSAGNILRREQTQKYKDGFENLIEASEVEEYDVFGNLIFDLNANHQGQAIEYTRTNGQIDSQTAYHYQAVATLADLKTRHAAKSALKEKTIFNLLGDVTERQTLDEKVLKYTFERDSKGQITKRTANTAWTGEDGRAISINTTEEWDSLGRLTREVAANGDETLNTYGNLDGLKSTKTKIAYQTKTYETTVTFDQKRAASGVLLTQSQTLKQDKDAFDKIYQIKTESKFDEFGDEIASVDLAGKGMIHEIIRWPWGASKDVKTYEYNGVKELADLNTRHTAAPKMIERVQYNFLGEITETQDKNGLITRFERMRRADGQIISETKKLIVAGVSDKVSIQDFDNAGRLSKSTDEQGIVTTYTYKPTGELSGQTETGTAPHQIQTNYSTVRYANGTDRVKTTITTGVDRFGRVLDFAAAQEFNERGDLTHSISETETGQVSIYERDERDRIRKLTVYELQDGVGFLAYAKQNIGASSSLTHLPLSLLKEWYRLLSDSKSDVKTKFPAVVHVKQWDALGNEILNETQGQEKEATTILTNALGHPSEIKKQITTTTDGQTKTRSTREVYDVRGYLLHYEDGFTSVIDYVRGFDGTALEIKEVREGGVWNKVTTRSQTRDGVTGHITSESESGEEKNKQDFQNQIDFMRDWQIDSVAHAVNSGKLSVDVNAQGGALWTASIFAANSDRHQLSGKLTLDTADASILLIPRYQSAANFLGVRVLANKIQVVLRENGAEQILF
ncbi:MAG: RHS repeat protein, partial [Candidatus Omnitrophica bacterium]|nr:RHS repeat protein [Candidatus Omnitrophota bacterium]